MNAAGAIRPRTGGGPLTSGVSWSGAFVGGAALIAFAALAQLLLRRADGLAAPAYDLAFFTQIVWNVGHGNGFTSSFNGGSFLGLHFSPLLLVPGALGVVFPDPRLLTLLHAFAIAASAPAAWLFLRAALAPSRLASPLAAALAAPLPIWTTLQEAARADFHTESLALPLALLAGWAGLTRRPVLLWAFAFAALLAKEDQGYTVMAIGLLVADRARGPSPFRRRLGISRRYGIRRHGIALALVGMAWTPIVVGLVMPILRADAPLEVGWYYGWIGQAGGPAAALEMVAQRLGNMGGWLAVFGLVLSLAGLPLVRPRWASLLLPPAVLNLLSANPAQAAVSLHYGLLLVVPAIVAAALGARRLLALTSTLCPTRTRMPRWGAFASQSRRCVPNRAMGLVAVPALVLAAVAGALPPALLADAEPWSRQAGRSELVEVAQRVPAHARIVVDDGLAAPLALRRSIGVLPRDDAGAWLIVDGNAYLPGYVQLDARRALLDRLPTGPRALVADDGRFQLWSPADE